MIRNLGLPLTALLFAPNVFAATNFIHVHGVAMHFPAARVEVAAGRADYREVFPGIDLAIYRGRYGFEYDWIVAPRANADAVEVAFTGAQGVRIAPDGDLILGVGDGEVIQRRPLAFQVIDGVRQEIPSAFALRANGHVGFKLGDYDHSRELVIDPALTFASGIGGSGSVFPTGSVIQTDTSTGMALDAAGNIYIAGVTYSTDFPLVNPIATTLPANCPSASCPTVFAAKLSSDGKSILYSTLLPVSGSVTPPSLAGDANGNVYLVSNNYLAKLDMNGVLKAGITFGGSGTTQASTVALGGDGKLYIAGVTTSSDFPVTAGAVNTIAPGSSTSGANDLFLMKLDPSLVSGSALAANAVLYSSSLGLGSSPVVAADAAGNAFVGATTTWTSWPTTSGVFQPHCVVGANGCDDGVIVKVNPAGSQIVYASYLGGTGQDQVRALALDGSDSVYLTGTTTSADFPVTPGAYQSAGGTTGVPYAVKLSPDATHLIYGTLLAQPSQTASTTGTAIAVDSNGNAWVGGVTSDANLPAGAGIQQTLFNAVCNTPTQSGLGSGGQITYGQVYCPTAGYIAELNAAGTSLTWISYLGGGYVIPEFPTAITAGLPLNFDSPDSPTLSAIVFDAAGNVLVTGGEISMLNTLASPAKTNTASVLKIAPGKLSLNNVGIENAAGYAQGLPAPGGLASLYVSGIPNFGTWIAPGLPMPAGLGGLTVSVNGVPAPLVAALTLPDSTVPNTVQVNFQVPYEIYNAAYPQAYVVEVQYGGMSAFIVPQQAGPGVFTTAGGEGAIQHAADYSLVTPSNPVQPGEAVIIYATGLGTVASPVASGTGATGADAVSECNSAVTTNLGSVLYAGLTPGFPGLYQVNVQTSATLAPGTVEVSLQEVGCWSGNEPARSSLVSNAVFVPVK